MTLTDNDSLQATQDYIGLLKDSFYEIIKQNGREWIENEMGHLQVVDPLIQKGILREWR